MFNTTDGLELWVREAVLLMFSFNIDPMEALEVGTRVTFLVPGGKSNVFYYLDEIFTSSAEGMAQLKRARIVGSEGHEVVVPLAVLMPFDSTNHGFVAYHGLTDLDAYFVYSRYKYKGTKYTTGTFFYLIGIFESDI